MGSIMVHEQWQNIWAFHHQKEQVGMAAWVVWALNYGDEHTQEDIQWI